ncbi:MAG: phosphoribosylformylglycinamidine synthase, partial [Eubacterium sp.]|nr:phosphoribosylformylglycinamidine synthase [Eubacterium sp.]
MSQVRRVYVEKKKGFDGAAQDLFHELRYYLGLPQAAGVRILVRYDAENVSEDVFKEACRCVFAEPPVDNLYEETFPFEKDDHVFSVEYLPGQFDQRADSAEQCIQFLDETQKPVIRSATTYVISGPLSDSDMEIVKKHCVNPVDSRICDEEKPETLAMSFPEPEDVLVFEGFTALCEEELKKLYESLSLAMTFRDFRFIQDHFRDEERRDPTITEIRVLDTYWSDHCRHTTFSTELKNITVGDGVYAEAIKNTLEKYLEDRKALYGDRKDKYICLMDLATMAARKLKKEGKLTDQEESDEINACSIIVPVDVNGKEEEWLINFKNETHNHPTEIEPFGGAATCLGGAIRDPLSGRTYVYQAMRVTGAADPTVPLSETLEGKLPQKTLTRGAARGYSSYGNQIGLATGYVKEIYHPGYAAKRMEIGAVLGAAPRNAVKRENGVPGDLIILLGGRTGRDGIGGATGSSKVHTTESLETCGAEVQKGNAPTERKLQRMFRREKVSRLIKKCNDFGAGGVSVAIGELADGLSVDLDKVPRKYEGLDGTELSISESQERMAVLIDPSDEAEFLAYADEENLEAVRVAVVTEDPRLVLRWRGKKIVDISRAFLDTNGARQETDAAVEIPDEADNPLKYREDSAGFKDRWLKAVSDLNACSQKGLVEMFDASIGAGSVLMPYGGRFQMTETQAMAAKVPVLGGETETVSLMSCGFDPYISSWSPYHGASWAITESLSRIVAAGGDARKVHFTFQEYFRRMTEDPLRWSQPLAALLGAYEAQCRYGLASIGGKDSMSGTFNEIDVPPTLVSFAVAMGKIGDIRTPELKKAGDRLVLVRLPRDAWDLPDYEKIMAIYEEIHAAMQSGLICAASSADRLGLAPSLSRMMFGNRLGIRLSENMTEEEIFRPAAGDLILEAAPDAELPFAAVPVGTVIDTYELAAGEDTLPGEEIGKAWEGTLESVFRSTSHREPAACTVEDSGIFRKEDTGRTASVITGKVGTPRVFIPVFPGTNCEYDSSRAFTAAGAEVRTQVFRNLSEAAIRESVEVFRKEIEQSQIIMFPGGFSAGDEPDGSAKFFATAFRNEALKEAVMDLLTKRDGLVLGICNGFQAL